MKGREVMRVDLKKRKKMPMVESMPNCPERKMDVLIHIPPQIAGTTLVIAYSLYPEPRKPLR